VVLRIGRLMRKPKFGYIVYAVTIVAAVILLCSSCVTPSKYDVELANRQNDTALDMIRMIEENEDIMLGLMNFLEQRITSLERGAVYQVAPYITTPASPRYLEPVED